MFSKRFFLAFIIVSICVGVIHQENTSETIDKLKVKLQNALLSKNRDELDNISSELLKINTIESAKVLLDMARMYDTGKLWNEFPEGYQIILYYLGEFTNEDSLLEIAKFVVLPQSGEVAKDVFRSVRPSDRSVVFYEYVLLNGNDSLKEMSIKKLQRIRHNSSLRTLINALRNEQIVKNEFITKRITYALVLMTEVNIFSADAWIKWFEINQDFQPVPEKTLNNTGTGTDTIRDPEELPPFTKKEIVVLYVKCDRYQESHNLDNIANLLDKMKIPYTRVSQEEFEADSFSMNDRLAILVNCYDLRELCHGETCKGGGGGARGIGACQGPGPHDSKIHSLTSKGISKIKSFVRDGGYLFCEDWNAIDIMDRAFPDYINSKTRPEDAGLNPDSTKFIPSSAAENDLPIIPNKGVSGHPYLKRVFEKDPTIIGDDGGTTTEIRSSDIIEHKWRFDQFSPLIDYSSKVEVLIICPKLGEETLKHQKKKRDGVAFTFAYGAGENETDPTDRGQVTTDYSKLKGGRVLFVLSHFGKQDSSVDKYTVQNLVLNFLAEAKHRKVYSKKKK